MVPHWSMVTTRSFTLADTRRLPGCDWRFIAALGGR
jgi:hypothetical protein